MHPHVTATTRLTETQKLPEEDRIMELWSSSRKIQWETWEIKKSVEESANFQEEEVEGNPSVSSEQHFVISTFQHWTCEHNMLKWKSNVVVFFELSFWRIPNMQVKKLNVFCSLTHTHIFTTHSEQRPNKYVTICSAFLQVSVIIWCVSILGRLPVILPALSVLKKSTSTPPTTTNRNTELPPTSASY